MAKQLQYQTRARLHVTDPTGGSTKPDRSDGTKHRTEPGRQEEEATDRTGPMGQGTGPYRADRTKNRTESGQRTKAPNRPAPEIFFGSGPLSTEPTWIGNIFVLRTFKPN